MKYNVIQTSIFNETKGDWTMMERTGKHGNRWYTWEFYLSIRNWYIHFSFPSFLSIKGNCISKVNSTKRAKKNNLVNYQKQKSLYNGFGFRKIGDQMMLQMMWSVVGSTFTYVYEN